MIKYKKGNLLDVTEGIIMHGCNCRGVMGSGVALAVKKKYPNVFQQYRNLCNDVDEQSKLLAYSQYIRLNSELWIINAFTQDGFGGQSRNVSYDAVNDIFSDFARLSSGWTLHIPKIGAGLGGGEWEIIEAIINTHVKSEVICWEL